MLVAFSDLLNIKSTNIIQKLFTNVMKNTISVLIPILKTFGISKTGKKFSFTLNLGTSAFQNRESVLLICIGKKVMRLQSTETLGFHLFNFFNMRNLWCLSIASLLAIVTFMPLRKDSKFLFWSKVKISGHQIRNFDSCRSMVETFIFHLTSPRNVNFFRNFDIFITIQIILFVTFLRHFKWC